MGGGSAGVWLAAILTKKKKEKKKKKIQTTRRKSRRFRRRRQLAVVAEYAHGIGSKTLGEGFSWKKKKERQEKGARIQEEAASGKVKDENLKKQEAKV